MSNHCRICNSALPEPDFKAPPPGLTSISTYLAVPTQTTICRQCGHAQSPDLPSIQEFYDTKYQISLQADSHDQLYEIREGQPVFRTEHQAHLLHQLGLRSGARILDFGAAKGMTLHRLLHSRPDLQPSVFDVSNDYRAFWQGWVPESEQAAHDLPEAWAGRFDLVTAHFVLEHVVHPVATLRRLSELLAPGGRVFFTVPNPLSNIGDLLVVDHLNHFTMSSLDMACRAAGLAVCSVSDAVFRGAFVVMAAPSRDPLLLSHAFGDATADVLAGLDALAFWSCALRQLEEEQVEAKAPVTAIYGAGFYGALIASRLHRPPLCFLDRNPFLQGEDYLGSPVYAPEDCPATVSRIYAGLNPLNARTILKSSDPWIPPGACIHYFKGSCDSVE
jgi:2-polyprenyl-3-methyl-5-hydroxy-6-metoxy-1,4-benzoquinol methylase